MVLREERLHCPNWNSSSGQPLRRLTVAQHSLALSFYILDRETQEKKTLSEKYVLNVIVFWLKQICLWSGKNIISPVLYVVLAMDP